MGRARCDDDDVASPQDGALISNFRYDFAFHHEQHLVALRVFITFLTAPSAWLQHHDSGLTACAGLQHGEPITSI